MLDSSRNNQQVIEGFWKAYSDATGLRIDPGTPVNDTDELRQPFAVTPAGAKELAKAAHELADQLKDQHEILKSQQAEMAARAALIGSQRHRLTLAEQIEEILSDAISATGLDSAVVYMLDELTEQLTSRFVFGLSPMKRLGATRPLRGARIDLETMVQGVVAIDDLNAGSTDFYRAPESAASGICVCLGDLEMPIGTIWLFGQTTNQFNNMQTAAARLAATNISNLLAMAANEKPRNGTSLSIAVAAEALSDSVSMSDDCMVDEMPVATEKQIRELDSVRIGEYSDHVASTPQTAKPSTKSRWASELSNWQHETLPLGQRLAPSWSVDGMIESPLSIAQSWHHWDVLPDGVMTMAMCQQPATSSQSTVSLSSTLDATIARAALQAHSAYRHSPGDAVMRVLDTLLQVRDGAIDETGQPNLSLFYAQVDPDTGETSLASVGPWSTLVVSKYGFRPVGMSHSGEVRPSEFMGHQTTEVRTTTLQRGEVLLVTGRDWMETRPDDSMPQELRTQSAQNCIGATIQKALCEGERSPLSAIRRLLASSPLTGERTAIALQYEASDRN